MAYRPEIKPHSVITDGDMSGSITSDVTIIQKMSMLSFAYSWTGSSPSGSISIQMSNDYALDAKGDVANSGTWNTITFLSSGSAVTSVAVSGNTGNGFIDIFQTGAYAVRTVYTRVSGSGTLQAVVSGKVA